MRRRRPSVGRLVALVVVGAAMVLWPAGAAHAHDPIFIDEATPPESSPLIEDGTISFATYGRIEVPGGSATVRVRLEAGQPLTVDLLVPDREPERSEADFTHLTVSVANPDGSVTELQGGEVIESFDEPFSQTSYLRLILHEETSTGGVHEITVTSTKPTRFTLATGQTEQFGSAVAEYERLPLAELATWYETPPAAAPSETVPGSTSTTVAASAVGESGDEVAAGAPEDDGGGFALLVALGAAVVLALTGSAVAIRRRS